MVLFRVWLNKLWFGSHNKILNFHDWILYYNELLHDNGRKWKSMDVSINLWHFNNMKVILPNFAKNHCFWTLSTLNYVNCIPFSCIDYFQVLFSNFQKTWFNFQLCCRSPVKSILFISPSVCLYVCEAFSSRSSLWIFLNFLHEDILSYILKSDKAIICLLSR